MAANVIDWFAEPTSMVWLIDVAAATFVLPDCEAVISQVPDARKSTTADPAAVEEMLHSLPSPVVIAKVGTSDSIVSEDSAVTV
jgi:hypothetical protein